jgi:hypothetical protein
VHHIVHRADGGGHDPTNLCLLCSSCHGSHHRGALAISGTAEQLEVRRPGEPAASSERRSVGGSARMISATAVGHGGARVDAADLPGGGADVDAAGLLGDGAHVNAAELSATGGAHVGAAGLLLVREVVANHMGEADSSVGREDSTVRTGDRAPVGAVSRRVRAGRRGSSRLDDATARVQAKTALVTMGWTAAIARAAVDAAIVAHGEDVPLTRLIIESLRRCPVPKA